MSENSASNRRIAKNTLLLYVRMAIIMLVSLYTSRIILSILGVEDFGIYNIVGGVVSMFTFINASMTSSTQRYLTYDIGRNDITSLKKTFSVSLNIHIAIAAIVFILAETIGLWMVNCKLVIPEQRIVAANIVYQSTIIAFIVNIIQVPYNSLIIAYEKMDVYAYVSIIEVILKLLIVFMLEFLSYDKLAVYGVLILVVQILITSSYRLYCKKKYPFCKFNIVKDKALYKQIGGFAGWNVFGSISWMLRSQGLNLLLNLFFGPAINAARGVAFQVNSAINNFTSGFQTAMNPQITKRYASGEIKQMETLVFAGVKYSYFLLFLISLPLIINVDYILNIWLKNVPDYTNIFVILVLVDSLISNIFGVPLMTALSATGNIKIYQVVVSAIICLALPISWVALKMGGNPQSVFVISIIISFVAGIARFLFCKKQIGFSIKRFFIKVFLPISLISMLSSIVPFWLFKICDVSFPYKLFCSVLVSLFVTSFFILIIGIDKNEKAILLEQISKIRRKHK